MSGFEYDGRRFTSLSAIAGEITGTRWNGFAFFGLDKEARRASLRNGTKENGNCSVEHGQPSAARSTRGSRRRKASNRPSTRSMRSARPREAFINSQRQEGWVALPQKYDDGGYTGANMDRPALKRLLADIESGEVNCVVVYKVDRLTRSLLDFSRIMEVLDKHGATFVSVTQQFNTTTSLGRLTLNILLSFAQFEREMISERTRDKMGAARRKGKWVGGNPVLGYDVAPQGGSLMVNQRRGAARAGDLRASTSNWAR